MDEEDRAQMLAAQQAGFGMDPQAMAALMQGNPAAMQAAMQAQAQANQQLAANGGMQRETFFCLNFEH